MTAANTPAFQCLIIYVPSLEFIPAELHDILRRDGRKCLACCTIFVFYNVLL
jgi:hypothetical protein